MALQPCNSKIVKLNKGKKTIYNQRDRFSQILDFKMTKLSKIFQKIPYEKKSLYKKHELRKYQKYFKLKISGFCEDNKYKTKNTVDRSSKIPLLHK